MTLHLPAFRVETAPLPITETAAAELAEVLAADERILAAWPREDCTPPVLFVAARPEGAVPVENRYSDPPGFGAYVARVATEVCAAAGLPYAFRTPVSQGCGPRPGGLNARTAMLSG